VSQPSSAVKTGGLKLSSRQHLDLFRRFTCARHIQAKSAPALRVGLSPGAHAGALHSAPYPGLLRYQFVLQYMYLRYVEFAVLLLNIVLC